MKNWEKVCVYQGLGIPGAALEFCLLDGKEGSRTFLFCHIFVKWENWGDGKENTTSKIIAGV